MEQICEAGIAEPKATRTKLQEQVLNGLPPIGRDTWMYRVSIDAVLRNNYLVWGLLIIQKPVLRQSLLGQKRR